MLLVLLLCLVCYWPTWRPVFLPSPTAFCQIRSSLESILTELKGLPLRVQQYEPWDTICEAVKQLKSTMGLVVELRSEALKDRHWKQVATILGLPLHLSVSRLTLGTVWNSNLKAREPQLKELLRTAQGELALENFLGGLKSFWETYKLQLAAYKAKCRLIKGWDEMFTKLDEHISNLSSMKVGVEAAHGTTHAPNAP